MGHLSIYLILSEGVNIFFININPVIRTLRKIYSILELYGMSFSL